MGIYSKKVSVVMEAFYGKPAEFIAIEKELDKILKVIKNETHKYNEFDKKSQDPVKLTDLNNLDSAIAVEKMIKKFFGFKEFFLCFYYPIDPKLLTPSLNAFTIPKTFTFFYKNKDGKFDPSKMSVSVNIDVLFCLYLDITAEELMSVILHEIGHNMDGSIFMFLSRLPIDIWNLDDPKFLKNFLSLIYATGLFDLFGVGQLVTSAIKSAETFLINNFPIVLRISTTYWEAIHNLSAFLKIEKLINILKTKNPHELLEGILRKILSPRSVFGYAGEKYADSFATAYGYGPANATFQNKVQKLDNSISQKTIYQIPLLNWGYDLVSVALSILSHSYNEHPHDAVRINEQLLKLKRDSKDPNLNPRLRRALDEQIQELEDFINNEYLNIEKNDNKKRVFTWLFNFITIKIFNNKIDFRELFEVFCRHEE